MTKTNAPVHNVLEKGFEVAKDAVKATNDVIGPSAIVKEITDAFYSPSSPMDPQKIQEKQQEEAEKQVLENKLRMILHQEITKPPPKDPNQLRAGEQRDKDMEEKSAREAEEKQQSGDLVEPTSKPAVGKAAVRQQSGMETKMNIKAQ